MCKTFNLEGSLNILKDFMKQKGIKTIDEFMPFLEKYSFHELYSNEEYRRFGNQKNYEDGDCTKLAYAIYSIIWYEDMKKLGLTVFSEDNFEKYKNSFSGDTINTFYTLFGKSERTQNWVLSLLNLNSDERKLYEQFKVLYQTIGNFYFLPKNTINRKSINTYRGIVWNDFFDIFLKALKDLTENNYSSDKDFRALFDANCFFFDKVKTVDDFLRLFYLKDEQESYNYLNDFVFEENGNHYRHNMLILKNKSEYKKFVVEYMTKANTLIEKRSRVLVRELGRRLKELNFSL